MIKNKRKILKSTVLVLVGFLLANYILDIIEFYKSVAHNNGVVLMVIVYISGILLQLIINITISIAYWHSYNIKYLKENRRDSMSRVLVASFLYICIIPPLIRIGASEAIFIISTLVLILRKKVQ